MDKLKLHTPDLTVQNIEKLAALFPNCVTETTDAKGKLKRGIDFDQLRQELSDHVVEGPRERYHLDWPGKREALLAANAPIAKTLRPCREESVDFDTTKNLFIEGDNLDALKLLQETYLGKVKLIYIDPPYNTGKDFIYRDKFTSLKQHYEQQTEQRDESGGLLVANTETNGRYHSDWLAMIYPRLKVAKNLLAEDGLIFISIDDAEQASLKNLCAELFGEKNFIAQLTWEKGRKNDAKFFSLGHEYMLVFARNQQVLRERSEVWREEKPGAKEIWDEFVRLRRIHGTDYPRMEIELSGWFSALPKGHPSKKWARYKRIDKHGPWRDDNISWPGGDGPTYDVIHPVTKLPCAVPERGWIYASAEKMLAQIKLGLVEFRVDHTEPPQRKTHIRPIPEELEQLEGDCETEDDADDDVELATQVRASVLYKQSQVAVKYLRNLMGGKVFSNPKDHEELAKLIDYATPRNRSAIIMDFFAGSGTAAEAVLAANASAGTDHRFIVVQLPEDLDKALASTTGAAKKTVQNAIKMLDKLSKPHLLSELTIERIRRAGAKIKAENATTAPNLDIGFRVLKIDTSNMKDVYYAPDAVKQDQLELLTDNIKEDRTPEDLLFQVLVDWGVDLSLPIEKVTFSIGKERKDEGGRRKDEKKAGGKAASGVHPSSLNLHPFEVFFVDGNALAACFDAGITEDVIKEIARRKPLRAVFRDSSYGSDSVKINVEQIFKLLSPGTELRSL